MTPYFADSSVTLWLGDALDVLSQLPDESVDCVCTSPPYYGLRDYGEPGQYGLEPSPAAYVDTMRAVFAQVRRVLAKDGTCWLNLGDSYGGNGDARSQQLAAWSAENARGGAHKADRASRDQPTRAALTPKNLLGIPWKVAFALQDDGWILRNAIVWDKPNAMPESVTDRCSTTYELMFLLVRSPRYFFDLDAIRLPYADSTLDHADRRPFERKDLSVAYFGNAPRGLDRQPTPEQERAGRNPGDVWTIPTQPFSAAHFAVMAPELARRAIIAGCKPGGTVLDPFCGSGTTGMVAAQHGRRFVGIDLSKTYLDLALRTRLRQTALIEGIA